MEALGSVAGTQNIDRILRLPGTINLAECEEATRRTHCMSDQADQVQRRNVQAGGFPSAAASPRRVIMAPAPAPQAPATPRPATSTIDWSKVEQHAGWLKNVNDLPDNFSLKGKMIVVHGGNLDDLEFRPYRMLACSPSLIDPGARYPSRSPRSSRTMAASATSRSPPR